MLVARATLLLSMAVLASACGRTPLFELSGRALDAGVADGESSDAESGDLGPGDQGVDGGLGIDAVAIVDSGLRDTGVGIDTSLVPDTGLRDTGVGIDALMSPDTGLRDTGVGIDAITFPDTGLRDTGVGIDAITFSDTGLRDTGVGVDAITFPDGSVDGGTPDGGGCAIDCSRLNGPCTVGVCNPNTGACESLPANDGSMCPSTSACSLGGTCLFGACVGGAPRDCSALTSACALGTCDPMLGCIAQPQAEGTACTDGDPCTTGDRCVVGQCLASAFTTPVATCAVPDQIPIVVGTPQSFGQSVVCQGDSLTPTCGSGQPTSDAVYQLNVDAPRLAFVTPSGTSPGSVLAVSGAICSSLNELACIAGGGGVEQALGILAPGTYFIGSEEPGAQPGFTLLLDPHDTCARPRPINAIPNGTVRLEGTTRLARSDVNNLTCGGGGSAADHFYELVIAAPTAVDIRTLPYNGQSFDTVLAIQSAPCGTGAYLACNDDFPGSPGVPGLLSRIQTSLQPGTYYVIVDGFSSASGPYTLEVTLGASPQPGVFFPDAGDLRVTAFPLQFAQLNDFVSGTRRPSAAFTQGIDLDLQIQNGLACDAVDLALRVNNVIATRFSVVPGQTRQQISVAANGMMGAPVSLRLEVTRTVAPGCGSIALPDGVSALTFR